ncbi:unnamed protein product [Nippostrongylus brasiliensis]|uniref:G_PROTEIN_RECEP_F1_2 domain-containing protein n=1 Tax=Nippostrongylus brasiliensis TaxID=27835 RepID=A0A0N4XC64_NIPBR|nr:unnamed protein product [Nippostrongylus brasiliensis]
MKGVGTGPMNGLPSKEPLDQNDDGGFSYEIDAVQVVLAEFPKTRGAALLGFDLRARKRFSKCHDLNLFQILAPFTNVFSQIHSYLYVFLCVVGVFANIAIVVVLLRPAMRRSPFNLFLICIAICDATLMATYLLFKHVSEFRNSEKNLFEII